MLLGLVCRLFAAFFGFALQFGYRSHIVFAILFVAIHTVARLISFHTLLCHNLLLVSMQTVKTYMQSVVLLII